ncbi:unnamed protein product [Brassica oleracea var. botrytis]
MEEVKVLSCGFYETLRNMNGSRMFTCYLFCGKLWLQIPCVLMEWLVQMRSYTVGVQPRRAFLCHILQCREQDDHKSWSPRN